MLTTTRPTSLRYGVAGLVVLLALLLKLLLDPLIETDTPFLAFFAAVTMSAWFGGLGPGIAATVGAALASDYFFVRPQVLFWSQSLGQNLPLGLFILEGVLISLVCAAMHKARRRIEVSKLKAHQQQQDLYQSEERYRLLIEGVRDYAIFMLDPDGQIASWNAGAERIHGYRATEAVGQHLALFYLREDQEKNLPASQLQTANQQGRFEKTELLVRKDGTRFWADVVITALRDESGSLCGFSKVTRDITERKRVQEALQLRADELAQTTRKLARTATMLEKRNQELDQFAYVLSHDLKAPLRAIANLSDWIEADLTAEGTSPLPEETQHHLHLLGGRVQRMKALIEAALQYSRIGRVETQVETVDVDTLLRQVIDVLAPPPHTTIEVGPGMPRLVAERLRLEQVFASLLKNAIKYYRDESALPEQKPYVQVSVQDQGEFYEFAVSDNGPGIPPRYHEKVFGIFQTLEARDQAESTGIGLALVKKIVESKGGRVWLESQTGQGATFHFTWPKQSLESTESWVDPQT